MAILKATLVLLPFLAYYLYNRLKWLRYEQFKDFPSPPTDLIWGHMKLVNEQLSDPDKLPGRHSDYAFAELHESIGRPPVMLLDFRPANYAICVIGSNEIAEQVSKSSKTFRYSMPKSPTTRDLIPLVGETSVLIAEDEDWKQLRKRFNAGFQPSHLVTLLPQILDKTHIFLRRLDMLCRSGEVFSFDELCVDLTFDIIGIVVMDLDFHAQDKAREHPLASYMRTLLKAFDASGPFSNLWPPLIWKRKRLGRLVDTAMKEVVRAKFAELKRGEKAHGLGRNTGRSVIALSFEGVTELDDKTLQQTSDTMKSFLFAGHDTTSILLQWAFYELSRSPSVLATLKAELDAVLGPSTDPSDIARTLLARGEEVLNKLTYLSAVLKETLRLYPPASSARMSPPGSGFVVHTPDGRDLPLDGAVTYVSHYLIQRDPAVYGATANQFVPERWLGNASTAAAAGAAELGDEKPPSATTPGTGIPPSAWRPFERGPRNCIGQDLANLEARVILACATRRYDFEKIGMGETRRDAHGNPVIGANGQYEVASELINRRQITAKPFDGSMMKVKFAAAAAAAAASAMDM